MQRSPRHPIARRAGGRGENCRFSVPSIFMPTTLRVSGKINSPRFQKARALAESVHGALTAQTLKVEATVQAMLPADYERYLESIKLDYGGKAWTHGSVGVIVTSDDGYVGDDEALITWMLKRKLSTEALNYSDGQAVAWEQVAEEEYAGYLATSGNQYAFLDIAVDEEHVGRLLFELYATKLPKTCANFMQLCTGGGLSASGEPLHYLHSPIHRVVKGAWIQGGDVVSMTGAGGCSIYGDVSPPSAQGFPTATGKQSCCWALWASRGPASRGAAAPGWLRMAQAAPASAPGAQLSSMGAGRGHRALPASDRARKMTPSPPAARSRCPTSRFASHMTSRGSSAWRARARTRRTRSST
jgi:cyclophilin family peptidyl-prolyl cis-trans isomerase